MALMLIITPLLELKLCQESEGLTFAEIFRKFVVALCVSEMREEKTSLKSWQVDCSMTSESQNVAIRDRLAWHD